MPDHCTRCGKPGHTEDQLWDAIVDAASVDGAFAAADTATYLFDAGGLSCWECLTGNERWISGGHCCRCGVQGGEEVEELGWLETPHPLGPVGVALICPRCQSVEEDAAATADMLRTVEDMGGGVPELVDAEIERVADRQRQARALDALLGDEQTP